MSRARKGVTDRPDPELEAQLRHGVGREWLEEAAEDEKLTELLRRRRLGLDGRIREMVHRGDRVRAETDANTFAGRSVYAGADFATIDRGDDLVEVAISSAVWIVEPSDDAGSEQSGEPLTFRARLAEIAAEAEPVRVVVGNGRAILGSITLVATDHIEIAQDQATVVVPIRVITAVVRPISRF